VKKQSIVNPEVTSYIEASPNDQGVILHSIRSIIHNTIPEFSEQIKWGRPVFSLRGKDILYLKTAKAYVTLGFFNALSIADDKRLEGNGKNMRHIKVRSISDVDPALLSDLIISITNQ
jgi:hypothetical protein